MKPSSQTSREIAGIHTDVLLQHFADRILVLVTQMGKVGCLVHILSAFPRTKASR
jgi:proteasome assembly chaperone 3